MPQKLRRPDSQSVSRSPSCPVRAAAPNRCDLASLPCTRLAPQHHPRVVDQLGLGEMPGHWR
eukprot:15443366-Alexandrium_andersonii.AAC.1